MFDVGFQELILILVVALLVFGPKRLPELGRALGRAMREFRRTTDEFRTTVETNLHINDPEPMSPTPEPDVTEPSLAPADPVSEPVLDSPLDASEGERSEPPPGEPYWAQRGSRLFHGRTCGWAGRIPEAERMYFKRLSEAREQGLLTCPVCEPWETE